jgi:hypothetical protein
MSKPPSELSRPLNQAQFFITANDEIEREKQDKCKIR